MKLKITLSDLDIFAYTLPHDDPMRERESIQLDKLDFNWKFVQKVLGAHEKLVTIIDKNVKFTCNWQANWQKIKFILDCGLEGVRLMWPVLFEGDEDVTKANIMPDSEFKSTFMRYNDKLEWRDICYMYLDYLYPKAIYVTIVKEVFNMVQFRKDQKKYDDLIWFSQYGSLKDLDAFRNTTSSYDVVQNNCNDNIYIDNEDEVCIIVKEEVDINLPIFPATEKSLVKISMDKLLLNFSEFIRYQDDVDMFELDDYLYLIPFDDLVLLLDIDQFAVFLSTYFSLSWYRSAVFKLCLRLLPVSSVARLTKDFANAFVPSVKSILGDRENESYVSFFKRLLSYCDEMIFMKEYFAQTYWDKGKLTVKSIKHLIVVFGNFVYKKDRDVIKKYKVMIDGYVNSLEMLLNKLKSDQIFVLKGLDANIVWTDDRFEKVRDLFFCISFYNPRGYVVSTKDVTQGFFLSFEYCVKYIDLVFNSMDSPFIKGFVTRRCIDNTLVSEGEIKDEYPIYDYAKLCKSVLTILPYDIEYKFIVKKDCLYLGDILDYPGVKLFTEKDEFIASLGNPYDSQEILVYSQGIFLVKDVVDERPFTGFLQTKGCCYGFVKGRLSDISIDTKVYFYEYVTPKYFGSVMRSTYNLRFESCVDLSNSRLYLEDYSFLNFKSVLERTSFINYYYSFNDIRFLNFLYVKVKKYLNVSRKMIKGIKECKFELEWYPDKNF